MWTERYAVCMLIHIDSLCPFLRCISQEGGVFSAKLTFVRPGSLHPPQITLNLPQPSDYPLSPFKMKFDPPLFHPNSKLRIFSRAAC